MSFREAMPTPNHPSPGALPLDPAKGLPFPRPPVPPPPNPGRATGYATSRGSVCGRLRTRHDMFRLLVFCRRQFCSRRDFSSQRARRLDSRVASCRVGRGVNGTLGVSRSRQDRTHCNVVVCLDSVRLSVPTIELYALNTRNIVLQVTTCLVRTVYRHRERKCAENYNK